MNKYSSECKAGKASITELWPLFSEHFTYDRKSGKLYWKRSPKNGVNPGDRVGAIDIKADGRKYLRTSFKGHKLYVHRIIMAMLRGPYDDDALVDHRDGDGLNNRPRNLRFADHSLNSANHRRGPSKKGVRKSDCVGVCWWKTHGLWKARIGVKGKDITLGCFKKYEDAVKARKAAEIEYAWSRSSWSLAL